MKNLLILILIFCTASLSAQKTPADQSSAARIKLTCLDQEEIKGTWSIGYASASRTTMGALLIQDGSAKKYILKPFTYTQSGSTFIIEGTEKREATISASRCGMSKAKLITFLDNCNGGHYSGQQPARTLFVRQSGNNTTAIKGQFHRSWADPFQAAIDADSGDLIIVYPGYWSMGDSSLAMIQKDADDFQSYTLFRDGIDLYFHAGATIELMKNSVGNKFRLWGNDGFKNTKSVTLGHGAFILNDNNASHFGDSLGVVRDWTLECDLFVFKNWWCINNRGGTHHTILKIKKVISQTRGPRANGQVSAFFFQNSTSDESREISGNAIIDIGEYVYDWEQACGDFGAIATLRHADSFDLKVTIGNAHGYGRGHGLLLAVGGSNALWNDCNVSFDVGNLNVLDTFINSSDGKFHLDTISSRHTNNAEPDSIHWSTIIGGFVDSDPAGNSRNNVTMNIGNITGHLGANVHVRNGDTLNYIVVNVGNISMQDSFPCVAYSAVGIADADFHFIINLLGRAQTDGVPIVWDATQITTGFYTFEGGTWESKTAGLSTVNLPRTWPISRRPITFLNTTFLTDTTVFWSEAADLDSVTIKNSYTNSLIVNPNVTENVTLITRDINVN